MAAEGETPGGLAAEPQTGPDGEIIGGPRTPQQIAAQRRLQQTQAQVDEVVDIMKTNVEKVLDRDAKLSELDDRADALQQGASQFEQQAKSLKNKFWLQNLKMMIIMGVIGIVIIGLLFGVKAWLAGGSRANDANCGGARGRHSERATVTLASSSCSQVNGPIKDQIILVYDDDNDK
ncbi:vesicle-associated membrane protein 2-like [Melitaea cinxia]|uniref:vesicle-associated membrane protein 2-like n=1 Tax=Melitaea cinxia TaxID=113334 RepID=UPI001E274CA3|nr:vesicle-associated membrane protein 2-like [Melitaea cinxia]